MATGYTAPYQAKVPNKGWKDLEEIVEQVLHVQPLDIKFLLYEIDLSQIKILKQMSK